MTEPTDDTLEAMMLAMLEAANNVEGYVAVQQYGIGTGGEAEMRAVFRVVQAALAAQGAEPVAKAVENRRLRRMLCRARHPRAYMDDGEAQDSSAHPTIDYLRDSLDDIEAKLRQRLAAKEQGNG